MNDIEVSKTSGDGKPVTYEIIIGDDRVIRSDGKITSLHINRMYRQLTHFEAVQLAGALLAIQTLTDSDRYEAMDTITTMLESMINVREKFGRDPLVQVNGFFDDDTNRERVGYTVTMTHEN